MEDDKGPVPPRARLVERPREEGLASAAFPGEEHGGQRVGDRMQQHEDLLHGGTLAHEADPRWWG
jgi:hypothetical protein